MLQASCVWGDTQVGRTDDLAIVVISAARGMGCQPFLQRETNALPCEDLLCYPTAREISA